MTEPETSPLVEALAGKSWNDALVAAALNHAREMEKWQREVARKTPDLPQG